MYQEFVLDTYVLVLEQLNDNQGNILGIYWFCEYWFSHLTVGSHPKLSGPWMIRVVSVFYLSTTPLVLVVIDHVILIYLCSVCFCQFVL